MTSILLLSTIYPYPSKENRGTSVCHYFAREWSRTGYDVRVVHYQAVYPLPLYWLARIDRNRISAKTGAVVYTSRDRGAEFEMDGVQIKRIPLFKPVPHGRFLARAIRKSIRQIVEWNERTGFVPDVIVGHFPNPQIEVVGKLRDHYPNARTAIVMHGDIDNAIKVYGNRLLPLAERIDLWGFRNRTVENYFARKVMPVEHSFICYSGVPEHFVIDQNPHDFATPIRRFVYVGEMIERKYPVAVLDALEIAYPQGDFDLTYIGDGRLRDVLVKRVEQEGLAGKVHLLGKIPREAIKDQFDRADCMVMISRDEAYGLVYLEAMARGCITIASRGEGFDGIIQDGHNGFLCRSGDSDELSEILTRIQTMGRDDLHKISDAAISTARWLTDKNAAKMYAENLIDSK